MYTGFEKIFIKSRECKIKIMQFLREADKLIYVSKEALFIVNE